MDGALIIDKPEGITSHDVVARVRKIVGERRVGHTGTLDPFATGVLVLLVGRATRLAQFLSGAEKEYEATIRLGFSTDTGDVTGRRVDEESFGGSPPRVRGGDGGEVDSAATSPPGPLSASGEGETDSKNFTPEEITAALASLRGEIEQTPPMYSARKIGGRKLYELAREGTEIERKPVRVNISEFEALPGSGPALERNDDGTIDLRVRVVCSAGTYVRTLAEDFGRRLGIGAHLFELRRKRAGRFTIEEAATLDRLEETVQNGSIAQVLISPDAVLSHLPFVQLDSTRAAQTVNGIDLKVDDPQAEAWPNGQPVRMCSEHGELIAVGMYDRKLSRIHPTVVIGHTG